MRLNKGQKEYLITLIAEGMKTDEINRRAAKFDPTFSVTRQQVEQYRRTRKVDIDKILKDGEIKGLTEGLATKEARVMLLKKLAEKMQNDLLIESEDPKDSRWWVHNVKGIGRGDDFQQVDIYEFNASEVRELRGVLDDIAAETSGRIQKRELSGPGGAPIPIEKELPDLSGLNDEEFSQFRQLFQKARSRNGEGPGSGDPG